MLDAPLATMGRTEAEVALQYINLYLAESILVLVLALALYLPHA
jgi:hypothetical protein